jgi:hypothetical protein
MPGPRASGVGSVRADPLPKVSHGLTWNDEVASVTVLLLL